MIWLCSGLAMRHRHDQLTVRRDLWRSRKDCRYWEFLLFLGRTFISGLGVFLLWKGLERLILCSILDKDISTIAVVFKASELGRFHFEGLSLTNRSSCQLKHLVLDKGFLFQLAIHFQFSLSLPFFEVSTDTLLILRNYTAKSHPSILDLFTLNVLDIAEETS